MLEFVTMETHVNASVKKACKVVGGQRAMAIALGIAAVQVNQWVTAYFTERDRSFHANVTK